MSGKFDAAINCLSVMADRDFANGAPHRGQFRVAIRVLEAAGKVDKSMCLSAIGGWQSAPDDVVAGMAHDQVVALLSALPDEEE